ncbi:DinB family protein [Flavobacterium crassostreae]|uniref:DinB-like domain-containing protein n=1 Tax=Flavobacterium crassostreae TaxID=1763534 RepID=A0A1B9E661_9FLAO|nr:DinB family protein [Flavobacterium crassostreae]OCB77415.1 hypothetical protein LPBF_04675 [Flavobacterium crassostreae]
MNPVLAITHTNRKILSQHLTNYTLEQLNTIPAGHNNNLIWNIAHVVVVQQMLVYGLSGLPINLPEEIVEKYKKGSKPEQDATQEEVDAIQTMLLSTIDQTQKDLDNQLFVQFKEYPTSTGFVLKNAQDAMNFNNFHEGIHLGVIFSIRKLI